MPRPALPCPLMITAPQRAAHPARPEQRAAALPRIAAAAVGALALLLASATAVSAHVSVNPASTEAGAFTVLAFRVPNESDTAGTVRLEVALPTATPLTSVRTQPIAGWDAEIVRGALPEAVDAAGATITEAPLTVVWTAQPGTQVGPGQYQDFDLSAGPLPEAGTELVLPVTQTYSDGEVVAWDEPTPTSGEEPEHPAPALVTTEAGAGAGSHGSDAGHEATDDAAVEPAVEPASASSVAPDDADLTARLLGGGGLVLGAGALGLAFTRTRRRT